MLYKVSRTHKHKHIHSYTNGQIYLRTHIPIGLATAPVGCVVSWVFYAFIDECSV